LADQNFSDRLYSWTVFDELQAKHLPGQPASGDALLSPSSASTSFHPVVFDALDGVAIRRAALRTRDAAGPSGMDAFCWRRLCTSFRQASNDLCSSLALVARRLCTDMVDPNGLSALSQPLLRAVLLPLTNALEFGPLVSVKLSEGLLARLFWLL